MKRLRFQQGDRVTWRDASGERQRGRVLQHSSIGPTESGERAEQVHVMREGSNHVTIVPPDALALLES